MDVLIRLRRPRAYDSRRLAVRFRTRTIQVSLHLFFITDYVQGETRGRILYLEKRDARILGDFPLGMGKASNCVRFYEMFL